MQPRIFRLRCAALKMTRAVRLWVVESLESTKDESKKAIPEGMACFVERDVGGDYGCEATSGVAELRASAFSASTLWA